MSESCSRLICLFAILLQTEKGFFSRPDTSALMPTPLELLRQRGLDFLDEPFVRGSRISASFSVTVS